MIKGLGKIGIPYIPYYIQQRIMFCGRIQKTFNLPKG